MLYRSILIPLDVAHPETAELAFDRARTLCAPEGSITVLHAIPDIPGYVRSELPNDFATKTRRKVEELISDLAEKGGVSATVEVVTGNASQAILSAAELKSVDLIIVSSHRPGVADYLLGSTASRVVRHAQCSVLVLR